ncbi:aspartic proteinase nepenthesin-2 [Morus notabilis]|uniref:aspartic proteinase nepenthesin-2 n=1 Tax=Morus notabilis TaxID=981085 RepID=UPI000CED4955|nr:aspartic proteinase nepenthesin-2 [Morus notabilis]
MSISNGTKSSLELLEAGKMFMALYRGGFYYVVETVIGSLRDTQFLLMDTGAGLVWTQCMPCTRCYTQPTSLYDSRRSTSYRKLPCDHFLCRGSQALYQCINKECVYDIKYGHGAGPTKGVASLETFYFALNAGVVQAFNGIIFGCSNDNMNFEFKDTPISGIMGLSWSPDSLVSQLAHSIQRRFSYCLVPYDEGRAVPSLLTFGGAIPSPIGNLQTTKFLKTPINIYHFYLNLLDVSVGGNRIGFPSDTFKPNQDGSGGIFIDSGSILTFVNNEDLPNGRNPYEEVIGAFQRHYDSFNLKRKENVPERLELCYEKPGDFSHFATMTYHFDGADYIVEGKYANHFNNVDGYFCVALLGGNRISILGAWHQQNKRIIYDGNIDSLHFIDEKCI